MTSNPRLPMVSSTTTTFSRKRQVSPASPSNHSQSKRTRLLVPNHPFTNTTANSTTNRQQKHLSTLLRLLSKDQLSQIITKFVVHQSANTSVLDVLLDLIPKPDVVQANHCISNLLNKLHSKFPYTFVNQPKYNDYEYSRVVPLLSDIQTAVIDFLDLFCPYISTEATDPADLIQSLPTRVEYLYVASMSIGRLPDWQTPAHNQTKLDLMHRLVYAWEYLISILNDPLISMSTNLDLVQSWGNKLQESNIGVHYQLNDTLNKFNQYLVNRRAFSSPTRQAGSSCALTKPNSSMFDFTHLANATSSASTASNLPVPNRVVFGMGL